MVYLELIARQEEIGRVVVEIMKERNISPWTVAEGIYPLLGFKSPKSAKQYVVDIRNGRLYGSSSTKARTESNLERLAILLRFLKTPEDDPVIKMIKEVDLRFEYHQSLGFKLKIKLFQIYLKINIKLYK